MNEEKIIKNLNHLIAETVIHGADSGGSYDSNWLDMETAIYQFLNVIGIDSKNYVLVENDYEKSNGIWHLPYLTRKADR